MDNEVLLLLFAEWQTASGLSKITIHERETYYRAMLKRLETNLLSVSKQQLISDLARPGLTPSSRSAYRSWLKNLFTFLQSENYRVDNPAVALPKVKINSTKEVNPLTTDDIQHLLTSGIYARTRMYVLLYAYQGFRPVEIAAISGQNIDWERGLIKSVNGKGGKEVWRPLHPLVAEEAKKYPKRGYWFPSPYKKGAHIDRKNVSGIISKALKRAGIVGHKPHNLRAWFATEQLEAGVPQTVVRFTMRHSDDQSIKHYYKPSMKMMQEAMGVLPEVIVPERAAERPWRRVA